MTKRIVKLNHLVENGHKCSHLNPNVFYIEFQLDFSVHKI